MPPKQDFNSVANFLWSIADLLNGAFQKSDFQDIMLPFTVLRRLDYALEPTKEKVLKEEKRLKEKGLENRHTPLCRASGYAFYNTSKFTYDSLMRDDAHLARNLRQYVNGFSENIREIFGAFKFDDAIRDLEEVGLLYLLMERFNEKSKVDLSPEGLSNHEMGYVFEHLLRKFNESLNANPGEHFTPREVIRLLVDLVLDADDKLASTPGISRTVNDCCCGTGGILSIAKEHILKENSQAKVHLYGQELNPKTWAVARSDMLILEPDGKDAGNIKLGSTLSDDQLSDMRFDYQFVNPPYGYEWSKDKTAVKEEAARGWHGRFGAGIPRISDGQMLFLEHFIARMNDPDDSQSFIGIIFNGSPLFTGDAGSGESEIRRWILENDWLEAIVALPQQIFYNTGIGTYIWLLRNRKPASHKDNVLLVDASGEEFWSQMRKSLGSKRREITDEQRRSILKLVKERKEGPHVKMFDTTDFGYRQIRVERPLRLNFQANAERLALLEDITAFKNLAVSKKKNPAEMKKAEEEGRAAQQAIREMLGTLGDTLFMDRAKFSEALDASVKEAGIKFPAAQRKAVLSALGERDEEAEICYDAKGNPEPDSELRDHENVRLKESIRTYFEREVLPHVPDAWIDEGYTDHKDGEIGKIGYEISFTRYFYEYKPLRSTSEILKDLLELEAETEELLKEVGKA